ncbi:VCBS repeat-containing protein [Catalinimonas niigatensis]|uniref:VCBS repeat-containing protein n=1 Tax=Catalinimonas niigatensis TaxID=1397264 RepID=UPI00266635B1|nr:VCBS repeat-containing protein [Catalinimonas niigatensis]WPP51669.1 VCBS repeat-containing protein [Catalinimonas niigatensis]
MNSKMREVWKICLLALGIATSCEPGEAPADAQNSLFRLMSAEETNIDFQNTIENSREFNIYTYRNFYNGGGVAIGDVNNDGFPDIYFSANMGPNKLYLNKGDRGAASFQFEDITQQAGVAGSRAWSTGVTMLDINGDGLLDIYVCNSGDIEGDDRQNELFINQGNNEEGMPIFTEEAEAYGLDDMGFSTHAAFFDYDKDGDLDVYLLNNSFRAIGSFNLKENERHQRDSLGGDKLYRNDTPLIPLSGGEERGIFVDVSEEAGIYGSIIGFGLGILVSDLDKDGWPDLYICNDFFERDYIYMNNRDGTFREELPAQIPSISMASMGADVSDLNGDGYPEIFVTEMLPQSDDRLKTSMTFENWNRYQHNVNNDYHHQFTRNMLHLNNGPVGEQAGNQNISFTEIGRLSGVEATDWSWSALMADLDNNGSKDIYITNGIYQDILNQDYLKFISSDVVVKSIVTEEGVNYEKLIEMIPSQPISNYVFSSDGKLVFQDSTQSWGLAQPGFSNGAAYADLDNDGDLDLVVNNVNMPPFIYQNQTNSFFPNHHYLKIKLNGKGQNTDAIGAKVTVIAGEKRFYLEQIPSRGFQSSVDHVLNFGLGELVHVDSLRVEWPSGSQSVLLDVSVDQMILLVESDAKEVARVSQAVYEETGSFSFQDISAQFPEGFAHEENTYSDFDKDALLFHMNSTEGPRIAVGDVNGDGREDIFIGGAKDHPAKLFLQNSRGQMLSSQTSLWEEEKRHEDVDALFFDANGDGDQDLYVVSGGSEYPTSSSALSDRLYLNDGKGNFTKSGQLLPTSKFESTSCVVAADYDQDGDQDLFVGVRLRDRLYGVPQNGYLLENDGKGNFTPASKEKAFGLQELGLIRDAVWVDYNTDGWMDLVVVGEWMGIHLFENQKGVLKDVTTQAGLANFQGWWHRVEAADLNSDGLMDLVVGNHGLNSRFRASQEKPIFCYINDFDGNGQVEQIICTFQGDSSYPLVLQHDLVKQLPYLRKKYLKNENYKGQQMKDIFSEEQLASSMVHQVTTLESMVLLNQGEGTFTAMPLPREAQISPAYALHIQDMDQDGHPDILLGGNLYETKPEVGRYDASRGIFLKGLGDGTFEAMPNLTMGLNVEGQLRDIAPVKIAGEEVLLMVKNNARVQALKIKTQSEKERNNPNL